jgi:hypothetical protein
MGLNSKLCGAESDQLNNALGRRDFILRSSRSPPLHSNCETRRPCRAWSSAEHKPRNIILPYVLIRGSAHAQGRLTKSKCNIKAPPDFMLIDFIRVCVSPWPRSITRQNHAICKSVTKSLCYKNDLDMWQRDNAISRQQCEWSTEGLLHTRQCPRDCTCH